MSSHNTPSYDGWQRYVYGGKGGVPKPTGKRKVISRCNLVGLDTDGELSAEPFAAPLRGRHGPGTVTGAGATRPILCPVCAKRLSPKQEYCSTSCKQKSYRMRAQQGKV